jgi:tetratricopeptide (TPR) repeat protein
MNVFLSCVSTEFKSYRLRLANQLGALKGHPYDIKVQEDFQQGGFTLLDKLADYIRQCNLVIHLAGDACGARPTPEHVHALYGSLGDTPRNPLRDHSYTQWEYHLSQRFRRNTLVYLAAADAPRDCPLPVQQTVDAARLQQAHVAAIKSGGKHYGVFTGYNSLLREVFHDLGLESTLKVNNLPFKSLGTLFKGRDEFLRKMHGALGRPEHHGHQRFAAITASATSATVYGLGGIGKTRAAIEYAHRYAEEYTALLFVRADTPGGLQQNFAALCRPAVLNLPEQSAREIDVQFAAVTRWLQQHPGWLLIFDNADTDDAAQAVEAEIGALTPSGQVLVTSRLSNWPGAVAALPLDVLNEADAAAFLLERTDCRRRKAPDDDAKARTLAVELGCLALALEQAGAYIERYRCTFADYFAEWQQRRDKVLRWFDQRVMQYPMSVAVTWQTSFDRLTEPARELLRILCWLAPDPIPESLLDTGNGPLVPKWHLRFPRVSRVWLALRGLRELDRRSPREALADLEAQSLVTRAADTSSFTVHRLVQDVTRRSLPAERGNTYMNAAVHWVNVAFVGDPQDVRDWPVLVPLAPHALGLTQQADLARISERAAGLMSVLGLLYHTQAQYSVAEPLLRRALIVYEHLQGSEGPTVATALTNLAWLLRATNQLKEAEPLMRRALAIGEHSLGPDHPKVAIRLNNLALLLQDTNRLADAEPLMYRALAIDEAVYGPDHPEVALDLNNLARLLHEANRLDEAELLCKRALAIDEAAYGPDHPEVALDLNNLARLLHEANRPDEAEPLYKRALAIDEKSYGPDHPDVAGVLNNLAQLLQDTNRLAEAERLMRRALAIDEQSYGPDHPDVARVLNNLARLLQDTNRLAEAEPLMRRHLEIFLKFTRSTGHEHPHLGHAFENYAALMQQMGNSDEQVRAKLRDLAAKY